MFVPTSSLPAGLRWFAEYQPFTPIMETLRALRAGDRDGHPCGRNARPRRQRFVRLRGVRAVTSARKFEQFGNLKWPLANLAVLGLTAIHARRARALVERYWYRARG